MAVASRYSLSSKKSDYHVENISSRQCQYQSGNLYEFDLVKR